MNEKLVSKKAEKKVHTLGSRFSQDVHGIFADAKKAVHTIIEEQDLDHAWSVPFAVVIAAAIFSVIGEFIVFDLTLTASSLPYWAQAIVSVFQGFLLTVKLVIVPIAFLVYWIFWSFVFHFIGSIVAATDVTGRRTFGRTMKLTGFMFAPMFLNILPILPLKSLYIMPIVTGFWSVYIAYHAMKANYETTSRGAFIIVLPYLFSVLYALMMFFLKLLAA